MHLYYVNFPPGVSSIGLGGDSAVFHVPFRVGTWAPAQHFNNSSDAAIETG